MAVLTTPEAVLYYLELVCEADIVGGHPNGASPMASQDYDNSIAITRDIHWVGFFDEEASLHCNPYLIIDDNEAVLIDPGSIPHFSIVMRKVIDLINPEDISLIIASHQDPDVAGNLAVVEDVIGRADLKIAAHSNTVRLIRHYGIRSECFAVDHNEFEYTLKSGRTLSFVPTPYLHAPGAMATYDRKTRSLFTSDLFGAISKEWSLFARGDFFTPMAAFHQLYMPSGAVLAGCMERLAMMEIDRILPQHGSILEGGDVETAIRKLKELPCGIDLIRAQGR